MAWQPQIDVFNEFYNVFYSSSYIDMVFKYYIESFGISYQLKAGFDEAITCHWMHQLGY